MNNFKGRYSKRKQNKDRGDVISYEDMPLDDYEQEKTDLSPSAVKKIIIGICIAAAAGLAVLAFANRDKLTPSNISAWWTYDVLGNAGNGYPVDIIGSEVKTGNFNVNQGRVAYASDTSFVTLNSSGSEIANVQLRYSKPVLKACEDKFITYGIGEQSYQIESFEKNTYTGEADEEIYSADIASNGNYCFITAGNGYLTELYAFDQNNNRIFKYSFSEYYMISVAINSDGSGCTVCGVTSNDGAIQTGVYVLDFSKSEPVSKYEISGDSIIDLKYISSNRIALVGENASYIIKKGDESYTTINYDDKTITNYCFNTSTNTFALALSKSGDGRSCQLITYNDRGEAIITVDTNYGAESISIYKGVVSVLDGNIIYTYDSSGTLLYTTDAGTGAKSIILTNESNAYVLTQNQIKKLDLKNNSTSDSAN